MSVKRQATTELNHDNWDQDDPADHEEMGTYKTAPKDVLEKRVIRTAKRRSQLATGDEPKKSVFSGFGGFNKTQPGSFDFLANLTNGNKANGSESSKTDNAVSSSIFGNKSTGDSSSSVFGSPASTPAPASTFGAPSPQTSSLFSASTPTTNTTSSLFTASKADSTVGDTNKPTSSQNTPNFGGFSFTAKSTAQVSSSMFGTSATSTSKPSSSTATTNSNSTPFKIQSVSSTTTSNVFGANPVKTESKEEKKNDNPKKLTYYSKLKGLNESVSDWIKKHVEETPLCILTPIFKDYENHLKVIQAEYEGGDTDDKKKESSKTETNTPVNDSSGKTNDATIPAKPPISNLFSNITPSSNAGSLFTLNSNTNSIGDQASTPFSFGMKSSPVTNTATPPGGGFSFGINKAADANEKETENADEDAPPKVEFTPVVEENSVFEKRCKIFVKKDGNFADKGVGTLYIKKIEDSGKHQLIVRANTNLGTLLVNLVLGSAIPTQRMGKNNVMMVCIPTPDSKPPPTPILIRVKTAEEADELLETLDKYKA
ncbi:nuclear pore complex protein Nup50 [Plutella xylostella]|uniref:nuclear pore complex protein Nup50 n=1 Tax=Plutella xylostella TaxID=51655 RepID=UPI002032CC05|nr:nuclear pore complex protein Nup50 [Plutella xylostella]